MKAFSCLESKIVALPNANIDTDQIIPARYLTTVTREGLGEGLFYQFRFDEDGKERPEFVLNRPEYAGAGILVAGDNFGCGSSREHAPWALMDFGIRCVISTSFADIFYANCFQNGLLPVVLKFDEVQELIRIAQESASVIAVDLVAQSVSLPSAAKYFFQIDPALKNKMLKGLDSIGETLQFEAEISRYERSDAVTRSWLTN